MPRDNEGGNNAYEHCDAVAAGVLDSYARRPAGASTLDLLKRIPHSSEKKKVPQLPDHVRKEMMLLANAEVDLQQNRKNGKPAQNTTTLGETLVRPKERFVPGTPVTRELKAGRLLRTDGKDILGESKSAPTLPHPRRVLYDHLRREAVADAEAKDALDLALQLQTTLGSNPERRDSRGVAQSKAALSSSLSEEAKLKQHRQRLEEELLHVTKKLNQKYTKQFFPTRSASPSRIQALASKWSQEQVLSEGERYDMYMEGRYMTQTQLDFYERDLEPRDKTNSKHRHHSVHSKYGDALAMNKNSLRGKF